MPDTISESWEKWRGELPILANKFIAGYYFPRDMHVASVQPHGFSNAFESAYMGIIYLRTVDTDNQVVTSLVTAKTKVTPWKCSCYLD